MNQQTNDQNLVFSYLELRKAVGYIGVALPVVLAVGKLLLQGPGLEPTISSYYYTETGNVFVGSLCAIGVFLLSTKGYPGPGHDQLAGFLACIFAVGVALFPMAPEPNAPCTKCIAPQQTGIGWAHWTFAALLFLTLAYFSLFLFTKTNTASSSKPTPQKLKRNIVYSVCGIIILASILLIPVVTHTPLADKLQACNPVFWLESIAVEAFGIAWLTKGETILKDKAV